MTTLAGKSVLNGKLIHPLRGAWTAEFSVSADEAKTGKLVLDDDDIQFGGTVVRGDVIAGRWHVLLVGGNGGLGTVLDARSYRSITAKAVVDDILSACGEKLAPDADAALLQTAMPFWQREKASAGRCLSRLVVDKLGANWRMRRDGFVWIGTDTYPEQKLKFQKLDADEASKVWHIATDRIELQPGVTFESRRVIHVTHQLDGSKSRSEALFV